MTVADHYAVVGSKQGHATCKTSHKKYLCSSDYGEHHQPTLKRKVLC